MSATLGSFVIWALAMGSAVFWGLRLWSQPQPLPAHTQVVQTNAAPKGDITRLLGTDPVAAAVAEEAPEPVADARLTLVGVVSPRGSGNQRFAMAVISVDGKPARTYRVGAVVDGARVLQSVSARGAELGAAGGPPLVSLSLPPPAEAARGFPGSPSAAPGQALGGMNGLPMATMPVNGEQPSEGAPGAEGQVPGQDRTRIR